jgi:hypothetical protein
MIQSSHLKRECKGRKKKRLEKKLKKLNQLPEMLIRTIKKLKS